MAKVRTIDKRCGKCGAPSPAALAAAYMGHRGSRRTRSVEESESSMILVKVTPQQYEELAAKVQQEGLAISGTSGTVTSRGVTAAYKYDGQANLAVEVTHAPLLLPKSLCESRIRNIFVQNGYDVV